jgi:N-acetylmuramoyl-L-alanine amidase
MIGRNDFTPEQMTALDGLLRDWISRYPQARICGHRDFPNTQKTCPNFDVAAWVKDRGLAG